MLNQKHLAQLLVDIHAVSLQPNDPFTWTSGLKSPIYCDNRLIMSYPKVRDEIEDAFVTLLREYFPAADMVAGTATAGIPHAAFIAQKLDLPMIYVRGKAKGHGKKNAIEGQLIPGQKVVMIEDLISTGGSVLHAAETVKEAGGEVLGVLAVFNYLLPASRQAFEKADYPLYTLTNFQALVEQLSETDPEIEKAKDVLEQWYQDPEKWGKRFEA